MKTTRSHASVKFPLTVSGLNTAFAAIQPQSVSIGFQKRDAILDGAWRLTELRRQFALLGFAPVGHPDSLLFTNEDRTVGLQCHGVEIDGVKGTWRTFYVEVEARPNREARQSKSVDPSSTAHPGGYPSSQNLFGL